MRFRGLDLNLLAALDALLSERSVSAAAERLCMTQPAMSQALARLRLYFDDELLVVSGRQRALTPRAEAMIGPLRQALYAVQTMISGDDAFDPAAADRCFAIRASDYALSVAVADAMAAMKRQAPNVSFDVSYPSDAASTLERRQADLIVMPEQHLARAHPRAELYRDDWVAVVWSHSDLAAVDIDIDRYFDLGHVAVRFGLNRQTDTSEAVTLAAPRLRRVDVMAPSFTAVPLLTVGTDLIATMPRRLAKLSARSLPLTLKPLPFEAAPIREMIQWSTAAQDDAGVAWAVAHCQAAVARLDTAGIGAGHPQHA